jgi:hypothetical protein
LPAVSFTFAKTGYFAFLATVMSLDEPLPGGTTTLRQRYIPDDENRIIPVPFLAVGFGIVLLLITGDGFALFQRRSQNVGARAGELDVSVVETVDPLRDAAVTGPHPDLFRTAVRGAWEEAGVDGLKPIDIHFLGFGVDFQFYQWNMLGWADIPSSAEDALGQRSRGVPGKWETRRYEAVKFTPQSIFQYLANESMWSTGWCLVYWTLVNHGYSPAHVNQVANDLLRKRTCATS